MKQSEYKLVKTIIGISLDGKEKAEFAEGITVIGVEREETIGKVKFTPAIIVDEKWIVPKDSIVKIKDISNGNRLEKSKLPPELQAKIDKIVGTSLVKSITSKSKSTSGMAIFGGLAGCVFALYTGRSVVGFGIFGAVAGGIVGNYVGKIRIEKA